MREQMTIEQFNDLKAKMQKIFDDANAYYDEHHNDSDYDEDKISAKLIALYLPLQRSLLSYDLSAIPFENWEGLYFVSDKDYPLDFSGTRANIDFNLIEIDTETKPNFHNCNVRNISSLRNYDENTFSREVMEENPMLFLLGDFPDAIKREFYSFHFNANFSIADLASLSTSQLEELRSKRDISFPWQDVDIVSILGLDKAIELYRYSKDVYEDLASLLNDSKYSIYEGDPRYVLSKEKLSSKIKTCETLEELKDVCYKELKTRIYTTSYISIDSEDLELFSETLKKELPQVFFMEEKLGKRFCSRSLSLNDVLEAKELFQGVPLEYFLDDSKLKEFGQTLGYGKLGERIFNNLDVLKIIPKNHENIALAFLREDPVEKVIDTNLYIFFGDAKLPLAQVFRERFGNLETYKMLLPYLNFFDALKKTDHQKTITLDSDVTSDELIASFENAIYNMIKVTDVYYFEDMPEHFKERYPMLFLPKDAPQELKDYVYSRLVANGKKPSFRPEWTSYLEKIDITTLFPGRSLSNMLIGVDYLGKIQEVFGNSEGFSFLNTYYKYFFEIDMRNFSFDSFTKEELTNYMLKEIASSIVNRRIRYSETLPKAFMEKYPNYFLKEDVPDKLKTLFYSRTLTTSLLKEHPAWYPYFEDVKIGCIFPYIQMRDNNNSPINFLEVLEDSLGNKEAFKFMLAYGKYLEVAGRNPNNPIPYFQDTSRENIQNEVENYLVTNIRNGLSYDEDMPIDFKMRHPDLFLPATASEELKTKYYNHQITVEDFETHPNLFAELGSANILYGLPGKCGWIDTFLEDNPLFSVTNQNRFLVYKEYDKIEDDYLKDIFKEYIMSHKDTLDTEKIKNVSKVLEILSITNSSEMRAHRTSLATEILNTDNPIENLEKVERVFLKNNLPTIGKIYTCFANILHPDFKGIPLGEKSIVSPVLKSKSNRGRSTTLFADLLRGCLGSTNQSIRFYLENIETGNAYYKKIRNKETTFQELTVDEQNILTTFKNHLATLYEHTLKGKLDSSGFVSCGDTVEDINRLYVMLAPRGNLNYDLADRVVSMFCHWAGIDTLEEAKAYIQKTREEANNRNIENAKHLVLEKGDFVKGIGSDIKALPSFLQSGCLATEFLGEKAGSDYTPLDTDFSMLTKEDCAASDICYAEHSFKIVVKNDNRVQITRGADKKETLEEYDPNKIEFFYSGYCDNSSSLHYGARAAVPASMYYCLMARENDPRLGFIVACYSDFYIPVVDEQMNLIFTFDQYKELREKMAGLSHYGRNDYPISDHLELPSIEGFPSIQEIVNAIPQSQEEVRYKQGKIIQEISSFLHEEGLEVKTKMDGDLTPGTVEFLDTGSTGRGTNKPHDADFDYIMRLDQNFYNPKEKLFKFRSKLQEHFADAREVIVTNDGDLRIKGTTIDDVDVDLDITFIGKTDKVSYSTEMCLQDRLDTIKKLYPDKYDEVLANIILAKQVLKKAGVYKSAHTRENPEGGLGGVGIENWILQNGGSFLDATKSFLDAAKDKEFEEFVENYHIWDFGENHISERKGHFAHDNFVRNNMSKEGFNKMKSCLQKYYNQVVLANSSTNEQSMTNDSPLEDSAPKHL